MKWMLPFCAAIVSASPVAAAEPQVAESKLAHSSVSVAVEPQLNDGRLVIKVAAKNGTAAPVPFGPGAISISTVAGQPIALSSLQKLINDVRVAAGMKPQAAPLGAPTAGAYAAPQMQVNSAGQADVSNYTGGSAIGSDEYVRQSNRPSPGSKPSIDRKTAETQIAALNQAILQDGVIQPGQIAIGQVVSEKLKFKKGEDRTLHLRVRLADDEHGFTLVAPSD
jgi:hypothetical protein